MSRALLRARVVAKFQHGAFQRVFKFEPDVVVPHPRASQAISAPLSADPARPKVPRMRNALLWRTSPTASSPRCARTPRVATADALSKQQRHFFPLGGFEKHSRVRAAHASRDIAARSRPDRLIATHASFPQVSLKPGKVSIRAGARVRAVPTRARRARHFPICAHRERFEHPAGALRFSSHAGRRRLDHRTDPFASGFELPRAG